MIWFVYMNIFISIYIWWGMICGDDEIYAKWTCVSRLFVHKFWSNLLNELEFQMMKGTKNYNIYCVMKWININHVRLSLFFCFLDGVSKKNQRLSWIVFFSTDFLSCLGSFDSFLQQFLLNVPKDDSTYCFPSFTMI